MKSPGFAFLNPFPPFSSTNCDFRTLRRHTVSLLELPLMSRSTSSFFGLTNSCYVLHIFDQPDTFFISLSRIAQIRPDSHCLSGQATLRKRKIEGWMFYAVSSRLVTIHGTTSLYLVRRCLYQSQPLRHP
ncbi:hypothetical protein AYX15_06902 [Cryptococcus neoformans]|nr:hypothetical protein AYX15_06902 [Cryptococcus neoformans var. grubii]